MLVDQILVAVPESHSALVGAVLLLPAAGVLQERLAAVEANGTHRHGRMSAKMGLHRIGGQFQHIRDAFIAIALHGQSLDLVLGL